MASRKRRLVDDDDDDNVEDAFEYKYDAEGYLAGTGPEAEADRANLASKSEVDRLTILDDRIEERNRAEQIWAFQQRKKQEALEAEALASGSRRRGASANQEKKKALQKLASQRKKAKKRVEVISDDEDEEVEEVDDDDDEMEEIDDEEIDDEEDDDDVYGDDYEKSRSRRGARRASQYDDDVDEDDDDGEDARAAERAEVQQIRLSRHKLEHWCHKPFFDDLVPGCFVRIGIGANQEKEAMYRCCEIVGIVERSTYSFGKTRTKKALRLKHGVDERTFRMEFVSNSEITESEFNKWSEVMKDSDLQLVTIAHVERKLKDIEEAKNYTHTSEAVQAEVEQKQKAGAALGNTRIREAKIDRRIEELQEQLDQLDAEENAEELALRWTQITEEIQKLKDEKDNLVRTKEERLRDRQEHFEAIARINDRNVRRNKVTRKEKEASTDDNDSMARRPNRPMLISLGGETVDSAQATPVETQKQADQKAPQAAPQAEISLAEAHSAIDIDIDIDLAGISADLAAESPKKAASSAKSVDALTAYKRANGLI